MTEHTVRITAILDPDPIAIVAGDTIGWQNDSQDVQAMSDAAGGQTFTTGPVQPGSRSLPIVFFAPGSVSYNAIVPVIGPVVPGTIIVMPGFEATIKPFFTQLDRDSMMDANHTFGIITFDLWSRDDVEANFDAILDSITDHHMPPAGPNSDGPWPQDKIDRFAQDFSAWRDGGFQP